MLVADVVDSEVDVQVVFFQRLPVGVDVVYAVTGFLAVYRALSAGDVGVFHALGVAAAPADFKFGVFKLIRQAGQPLAAGVPEGERAFVVFRLNRAFAVVHFSVQTGFDVRHAGARGQAAPAVGCVKFVAVGFERAAVVNLAAFGDGGGVVVDFAQR